MSKTEVTIDRRKVVEWKSGNFLIHYESLPGGSHSHAVSIREGTKELIYVGEENLARLLETMLAAKHFLELPPNIKDAY
ncbi:MAG: hypothetical protein J3T61_10895 [Candidatus Brocadiales bacterium]|nr:hypothetical protein [Candidatus Bathyanammoxibius sp.]